MAGLQDSGARVFIQLQYRPHSCNGRNTRLLAAVKRHTENTAGQRTHSVNSREVSFMPRMKKSHSKNWIGSLMGPTARLDNRLHVVCPVTAPHPLQKILLHRPRSSASSFNFQYPLLSSRSSSNCERLLPRLPVSSSFPSVFPSTL